MKKYARPDFQADNIILDIADRIEYLTDYSYDIFGIGGTVQFQIDDGTVFYLEETGRGDIVWRPDYGIGGYSRLYLDDFDSVEDFVDSILSEIDY